MSNKVYFSSKDYGLMKFFEEQEWYNTNNINEAHLIVFPGGQDINTKYYGEENVASGKPSDARDEAEIIDFYTGYNENIPMVGVCRGAQLLNVCNGGSLWQHVDGHLGVHSMVDKYTEKEFLVTSTHHQMMRPGTGAEIVATVPKSLSKVKINAANTVYDPKDEDLEVVRYNNMLCFQGHPEYNTCPIPTKEYFWELLEETIEL